MILTLTSTSFECYLTWSQIKPKSILSQNKDFLLFLCLLIKFKLKIVKNIEKVCKKNQSKWFYFKIFEATIDR